MHVSSANCSQCRWSSELQRVVDCACTRFEPDLTSPEDMNGAVPATSDTQHSEATESADYPPVAVETQPNGNGTSASSIGDSPAEPCAPPVQENPVVEESALPLRDETSAEPAVQPADPDNPRAEEVPSPLSVNVDAKENPALPEFLSFFGLREQPFGVTPDPAYLYLGRAHREALSELSRGVEYDRGFMALIAKPGMGKTTLLNKILDQMRDTARMVFLFQTQCDSREFFQYLLGELGVDCDGMNLVAMHKKLNEILFQEMLEGRRFVLVVDEAQNLQETVLETIRLLSDFETNHVKLLEIILVGQPQLAAKLARPNLSQLCQRLTTLVSLDPFSADETARYIEHRLRVAGYTGAPLFSSDAVARIAERSEGIPRKINNLCFNALMLSYSQGRKTIDSSVAEQVAARLNLESFSRRVK